MKLLFMGTPDISAHCLAAILACPQHEVCGVFTREDKPVGRKQVLTAPPVKELALAQGIPVWQPKTLRDGEAARVIAQLAPDLLVVVAYGRILPQEVLDIPPRGSINLHVSLLPQYRGAAPIQWAVLNGDAQTGVTVQMLDAGIDTGDVLDCLPVAIDPDETSGELFDKVTQVGAPFLCKVIDDIAAGSVKRTPQNHEQATHAPMLSKEMALFAFSDSAARLHNLVRGLNPWPVAYFMQGDKKIKVLRTRLLQNESGKPGEVLSTKPLTVACGSGALVLEQLVPEGAKPMDGTAWAAGRRLRAGDML